MFIPSMFAVGHTALFNLFNTVISQSSCLYFAVHDFQAEASEWFMKQLFQTFFHDKIWYEFIFSATTRDEIQLWVFKMEEIPRTVNVRFEDKFLQIKSSVRLQAYSLFSELRDTIIEKLRRANEEIGMGKQFSNMTCTFKLQFLRCKFW